MSNLLEMGMNGNPAVVARVAAIPEYRQAFKRVFMNREITIDTIVKAIAAYERTQLSANSPFDRFIAGDAGAISEAQKRGWELFKGKAKCTECHVFSEAAPFFTDSKFHNTGIVASDMTPEYLDGLATKLSEPQPSNSIDVVRFYNRGGNANAHLDERMHPLNLSDQEMNELVEFMRALTSDDVLRQLQSSVPQNRTPVRY